MAPGVGHFLPALGVVAGFTWLEKKVRVRGLGDSDRNKISHRGRDDQNEITWRKEKSQAARRAETPAEKCTTPTRNA